MSLLKIDENTIKEAQQIKLKAKQNKEEMVIHTSRNTTRKKKDVFEIDEDEPSENKKSNDELRQKKQNKNEKPNKNNEREHSEDRENEGEEDEEDDCDFGDAKPDPGFEVYDMKTFLLK